MKPVIAITMGDPAGIGAEICVKALSKKEVYDVCAPVIIGDRAAVEDAMSFCGCNLMLRECRQPSEVVGVYGEIDMIDLACLKKGGWSYKEVNPLCGKAAFEYIKKAIGYALDGSAHAVVTAPINKESLNAGGIHYSGHTEIFADMTGTKRYAMLLATESLSVIHVTTHVSMRRACELIKKDRVLEVIELAREAMELLGKENPRIAVAGLNAHCSENGLFGNEENDEIIPAVAEARRMGINAEGPIPPDTVFVKAIGGQYDIVVAMYHDQGHIPVKLSGFRLDPVTKKYTDMGGINYTIGLPIIRVSVDHGTAFDIAGEGKANEGSLLDAIYTAAKMAKTKYQLE